MPHLSFPMRRTLPGSRIAEPDESTARLLFVGDLMLGRRVARGRRDRPAGAIRRCRACGSRRGSRVRQSGIPAHHSPPYLAESVRPRSRPCRGSSILSAAGFDVLGIANNHAGDAGPASILDTIDAVSGAGCRRSAAVRTPTRHGTPAPHRRVGAGRRRSRVRRQSTWTRRRRWARRCVVGSGPCQDGRARCQRHRRCGGCRYPWRARVLAGRRSTVGTRRTRPRRVGSRHRVGSWPARCTADIGVSSERCPTDGDRHQPRQLPVRPADRGDEPRIDPRGACRRRRRSGVENRLQTPRRPESPLCGMGYPRRQRCPCRWRLVEPHPRRSCGGRLLRRRTGFPFGDALAAAAGDITGDGTDEILVSFRHPMRSLDWDPRPLATDASGRSAHIGVFESDWTPVWMSRRPPHPVRSLAACDGSVAFGYTTLDDPTVVATGAGVWNGFGFTLATDLAGPGTPSCADIDLDGVLDAVIVDRTPLRS